MTVNKVILVGNLGKDPESRTIASSGSTVATFSLATGERRKDQSGNWVNHTEWHRITAFGKLAEFATKYLKKGKQVYLEGKLRTNKWQDKEGKDRYTTEILADVIRFVGTKDSSEASNYNSNYASSAGSFDGSAAFSTEGPASSGDAGEVSFEDDDIPF